MNVSAPTKHKMPWRKIISVGIILLVVGYKYAQPTLVKWTGVDLPAVNGQRDEHNKSPSSGADRSTGKDYTVNFPSGSGHQSASGGFALKEVGRDRYQSPAGLLYTMGSRGEHRIEHVMRHAEDMAGRPAHGVFIGNGDRDTVLQLIDDAWQLAVDKSPKARYEKSKGNDAWTVDMGRKVGFDGGKKGQRNGGRSLNSIKLILAKGNQVITAYPVR
jgi:hypothetical protein